MNFSCGQMITVNLLILDGWSERGLRFWLKIVAPQRACDKCGYHLANLLPVKLSLCLFVWERGLSFPHKLGKFPVRFQSINPFDPVNFPSHGSVISQLTQVSCTNADCWKFQEGSSQKAWFQAAELSQSQKNLKLLNFHPFHQENHYQINSHKIP